MVTNMSQDFGAHNGVKPRAKGITRSIRIPWSTVVLVCSGSIAIAFAERPAAGRLAWDQDAPNLATAQSYQYSLVVDGGPASPLANVKCTGAAPPFACTAPLPQLEQGAHSLVVTASVLTDGSRLKSPPSAPLVTITLNGATLACSSSVRSATGSPITSSSGIDREDR